MLNNSFPLKEETKVIINPGDNKASAAFILTLSAILNNLNCQTSGLIILCIGSDRSTGDALGPLVGTMLENYNTYTCLPAKIMGTLSEPVHALNIEQKLAFIKENFTSPVIIAIDASLGQKQNIGCIEIGKGGLKPGAAVNKTLPLVGDVYITGIVNMGGFMEFMVLQSTRLSVVFHLASFISRGICRTLTTFPWLNNSQQ